MRLSRIVAAAIFAVVVACTAAAQQGNTIAPSRAEAERGAPYALGTFEEWSVRCIRGDDPGSDPCQMTQRLLSEDGSPTAEVSIFPVPDNEQAAAGATIVTPLETLLQRGIRISVDGGEANAFPFQFCNRQGCIAQVGLSLDELNAMKAGAEATVTIYPVAAPDTAVNLPMSLAGFTAAYETLEGIPGLE